MTFPMPAICWNIGTSGGVLYETDFGEYTTDTTPSDWVAGNLSGPAAPGELAVRAVGGTLSGKVLRITAAINSLYFTWSAVPAARDVEILAVVRHVSWSANGTYGGALARFVLEPDAQFAIATIHRYTSTQQLNVLSIQTESTAQSPAVVASYTPGVWAYIRFQLLDTAIKMRRWTYGTAEPASWSIEETASADMAAGLSGLVYNAGSDFECQYFAVGAGGLSPSLPA